MNADALIGAVLGTCTLQKLVGQGGMGAVYLAQQSRPRRQVAVKVLLPMTPLTSHQLAAFLERFRRETDAAASLEHPNIVPVHEYGERDGLAYLVMPYISGGTLRDEMERVGPLPLENIVNYLEQMAVALDFAHERGVIHRDIKPANILMTLEGRLLLTDFGLVKIVAEGQPPQARLTGAGAPVGTPDYMAPEQVIGEGVDARADLYSLGVILYQMVTGTTPFQGETPMQIAAQHLQIPPPSPQMLRPDLPAGTERVMLRSLSKRPADRYPTAQELARAFRMSLVGIGNITSAGAYTAFSPGLTGPQRVPDGPGQQRMPYGTGVQRVPNMPDGPGQQRMPYGTDMQRVPDMPDAGSWRLSDDDQRPSQQLPAAYATSGRLFAPKTLLDTSGRPTGMLPSVKSGGLPGGFTGSVPTIGNGGNGGNGGGGLLSRTGMFPTASADIARPGGGLLSRTGKFPQMGTATGLLPAMTGTMQTPPNAATMSQEVKQMSPSFKTTTTGSLMAAGQTSVKLTGPVKVVQVPVAGQPGRYITGLLPILPQMQDGSAGSVPIAPPAKKSSRRRVQVIATVVAILVILVGSVGAFLFVRSHQGANTTNKNQVTQGATGPTKPGKPNLQATAAAQATAAFQANTLLFDPLGSNIHNWPALPADVYAFKDGAYHITDRGDNGRATVLQARPFTGPLAYTLTVEEINGDDASPNNSFGMILRFNQQNQNNKTITTFYSFEVVNTNGGEYQFWKYDDTHITAVQSPWTELWHQAFGNEFHQGHGPKSVNTFKIAANGAKFVITVNGKLVNGMIQDGSLASGTVGMIVNLNGTEVAFKDMLLTRN